MPDLTPLLCPRSIAVIGASTQPDKVGGVPIRLLRELGYGGAIYPVHVEAREIQGLRAYPALRDVEGPVDLAIVAVPVASAVSVMDQLTDKGVRAAIYFTSGFAEVGGEGVAAQQALAERALAHDVVLLGPNCLGAMNLRKRMFAIFAPTPLTGLPPLGEVGLVSQSGAFGLYAFVLAREAQLGLSHWVTTGNEAGLQVADVIEWLSGDANTSVILAYLEGCRDGARLRRALMSARAAGKPVVICKVGMTEAGARSAQSHTASLAGVDAVYQAVFDEYGVHRAHTIEEFFRLGYVLSKGLRPRRWHSASGLPGDAVTPTAIVTVSGGVGIMLADRAEERAIPLPPLPTAPAAALRAANRFTITANPIDVTGQVVSQPRLLMDALEAAVRCGEYGSVVAFLGSGANSPRLWSELSRGMDELSREKDAVPIMLCGLADGEKRAWLEARGCLVFRDPAQAIDAIATLTRAAALAATPASAPEASAPYLPPIALPATTSVLLEHEAMRLLEGAGVPVVVHGLAHDADEAARIAERLGYPVVLKLCSREILHKSDVGGVALGLADEAAVRGAFDRLRGAAARRRALTFEGVLVARLVRGWGEVMVGVRRDPVFGLVAMAGIGGTGVEIIRRTAFGLAPLSLARAHAMLEQSRVAALFRGHRGNRALRLDGMAEVLVRITALAEALGPRLDTLEINPFIVHADGVVAVDAVITLSGTEG
jgi:acetate---CoA ligase (ADP-forming)